VIREGAVTCAAAARTRIMHEDTRQILLDFFAHDSDIRNRPLCWLPGFLCFHNQSELVTLEHWRTTQSGSTSQYWEAKHPGW